MTAYEALIERLIKRAPESGYQAVMQIPPLSSVELATVIEREPNIMASVQLNASTIVAALNLANWERAAIRISLHTREALEMAARGFLFCELTSIRDGKAAAAA